MGQAPIREYFYLSQIALGVLFLVGAWLMLKPGSSESNFKVRESDLERGKTPRFSKASRGMADSKIQKPSPALLGGIRIDGQPHEILGVAVNASEDTIQKAYRDLMKRYHPDKIGPPQSREWKDAQKIAESIIRAKSEMLKRKG